ncbi:MAG: transcriptional repressor NrdR [Synergistaceae bacterium]|jgi:transcriptional repressor NrdR|nr:transcriptional repressor NrdR [Synergistaceae bacterium]MBP9559619.1 transcriptional repressor NrdR [Synergistaceae bacterium]MBP9975046.1 transcriptional repressor NrdR [Synergistaceae bacterium]MCE5184179.1 transcriptional regulator NrdR [Synergistaceae bacterium]PKL04468.1 MAG: transcriptional regulator NrdR [Synergistetes bacterium HGW-Synergistetes-1]
MRCPACGALETRVIETRSADEGRVNRRRRECPECQNRFTTYERLEEKNYLWVVKKGGSREAFDRGKLMKGLQRACEKLAVPLESIEEAVANVEAKVRGGGQGEVPTSIIGEYAAEELRKIDKVAYVRFASVYREFTDISSFTHEIAKLLEDKEAHRNGK